MAFKMKGHALPGINQKGYKGMKDGRFKASAFQKIEDRETVVEDADSAEFPDYDALTKSKKYLRDQKGKGYSSYTYWEKDRTDEEGNPLPAQVRKLEKNIEYKTNNS